MILQLLTVTTSTNHRPPSLPPNRQCREHSPQTCGQRSQDGFELLGEVGAARPSGVWKNVVRTGAAANQVLRCFRWVSAAASEFLGVLAQATAAAESFLKIFGERAAQPHSFQRFLSGLAAATHPTGAPPGLAATTARAAKKVIPRPAVVPARFERNFSPRVGRAVLGGEARPVFASPSSLLCKAQGAPDRLPRRGCRFRRRL